MGRSVMQLETKPGAARASAPPQLLRATSAPAPRGPAASLLTLQRTHGNRFVQRLVKGPVVQRSCACGGTCAHCRAEGAPQQDPVQQILQRKGSGRALEPAVRGFMETGFGADFGSVRVHTDAHAAQTSEQVNALAYTVGQDIFFNAGQYQPQTTKGRWLLAHELTHVVQQQGGMPAPAASTAISEPGDPAEQVADRVADEITSGQSPPEPIRQDIATLRPSAASPKLRIQRVVNEAKVGCRTDGIPSLGISGPDAVATIRQANVDAILMAISAESSLFIERLFGPSDPNFATILNEELGLDINNAADRAHMEIVERRFALMRRVLESDFTGHTCIGAAAVALATGTPAACAGACCTGGTRACSCHDVSHIVLCRPWWTGDLAALHQRPGTLIHEAFHIYFGFINDFTTSKLSDAHCYTGFVERLAGVTPFLSCAGR